MSAAFRVLATGPLTTVQDLGRVGYAHWGVTRSGAADRASARLANRLVGNPQSAACLEVTFGGLRVRTEGDLVVALTGAPSPVTVSGRDVGRNVTVRLRSGEVLELGPPERGVRSYVAVRGGVDVAPVLGSRATDLLGHIGPPALAVGDRLTVGSGPAEDPEVDLAPVRDPVGGEVELRIRLGPRADWFTADAVQRLVEEAWVAAPDSSRIGLRLEGPPLQRAVDAELPSEGMVRGAVQVPPDGAPTLLLADHPVTGGYPVIAVVLDADVDRAAQVRPGQHLRFRPAARRSASRGAAGPS